MKILKSQKDIFIGTLVFGVLYGLVWALLFSQIENHNIQIMNYLADAEKKIDAIEATVSPEVTLARAIDELNAENDRIHNNFRLSPNDSLRVLSMKARRNNLKVLVAEYAQGEPPVIDSSITSALGIHERTARLKLDGRFGDILGYLKELRTTPDLFLDIAKLNILKPGGSGENCQVVLDIKLFLST